MKREIKFRAWDKDKHKMFSIEQIAFDRKGNLDSIYCDGPDFSNDPDALMGEKPDLDRAVLMQYTGMHDKNGREIYEADVVSFGSVWAIGDESDPQEESHCGVVEFDSAWGMYKVNCGADNYALGDVITFDGYGVIGNKFENPELLEEEK